MALVGYIKNLHVITSYGKFELDTDYSSNNGNYGKSRELQVGFHCHGLIKVTVATKRFLISLRTVASSEQVLALSAQER